MVFFKTKIKNMQNKSLITEMMQLQTTLNNATNGEIWLSGKTKEGREINWYRCMYMEAVEALDSFNWKHWKDINSADDMDNIKVEIIDIWHFVMSEIIYQNEQELSVQFENNPYNFDREKLISSLEKLVYLASSYQDIEQITQEFFNTLQYAGISIQELYNNYLVKNILNQFRQDNGYKDGSYIKNWDGVEDNVIAFNILDKNPNIGSDELYAKLTEIYKKL
jgi:dimeric dUTPase (all-alpha-NTP-PPase superfamily)